MTILVTGASGFLGTKLVHALTKQNKKVRILVRKTANNIANIDPSKVELRIGDITEKDSLSELMDDVEVVYHCAAKLGVGRKKEFYSTNVGGTENLLQEAVRTGVSRFVHVSSVSVMSEYHDHFGSSEEDEYASSWTEPYTPSKIEAEKAALRYSNDLKVIVIRPGWIWGAGDINTFNIAKAIMTGFIPCIGTGDNILSLTYIRNVIHAVLLAGKVDCSSGQIFLVNDFERVSQKQFIHSFAERLNPDARPIYVPFSLAYKMSHMYEIINRAALWRLPTTISRHSTCVAAKNLEFCLEKSKRILKFDPPVNFKDAVDETVMWFYDRKLQKNSKPKVNSKGLLAPILGRTAMAHFAITSWCNAKCVFCSYPDSNQRISVKLSDAIRAINSLKRLGVGIISLTGGEPFLNKDIFRIACHASSVGMLVFTGTNGSLMTEEEAFRLSKARVRAVWISYEGPEDDVFDKNRGVYGLSKMIRQDLKWLRNAGIDTFAICVINKSITDYRQFVDHLIDVGFDKVKFDYPMTNNMESGYLGFKDLELIKYKPNEIEDVIRQIIELKKSKYRGFGIINPTSGLEGAIDYFKERKNRFGCAAGYRILYIDWNLDLYRCTTLPEKFGKVWDVSPEQLHRIDCNKCYYQGTRDYDSVYYFLDSIKSATASASQGGLINALHSIINENNLDGLSSIFEIASS